MSDYNLIGVKLNKDELEPPVFNKPLPKLIKISLSNVNETDPGINEILLKKLILEHERKRFALWYKYFIIREKKDVLNNYSRSIMD